jgi:CDP-6-deoxy-D-xylo-4-hexulose-3-dehydrase
MSKRARRKSLPSMAVVRGGEELRERILELVQEYARVAHTPRSFVPGKSPVAVSGKVFGPEELRALVDSSLDFWLTSGRYNTEFEERLASVLGLKHLLTTNSGSSANLLAVSALTSPRLKSHRLKPGDEVLTVAAGFPTTVNPIIQNGLIPVFLDVDIPTYNVRPEMLAEAVGERTRAIVLAHTLGNPFDLDAVMNVADEHGLWVVEDCCDALGSTFNGRIVGTFGHMGTLSFYPAHHITMGEGGAVFTNRGALRRILESIRDWGRDCWCAPGNDNTCNKRFGWKLGALPEGYDHKYIYSHMGYNLKITDMQAAVGVAQLGRLDGFIAARKRNFRRLRSALDEASEFLILPEATPGSDPAWFGFPITIRESAPFSRAELIRHLDCRGVATRNLFAGNLLRQPYMQDRPHRVVGNLTNTDTIMNQTFWVGVFPGLVDAHVDFIAEILCDFMADVSTRRRARAY